MAEAPGAVDTRRLGGRYRVGALLGAGGMGEVWAARDLLLDRPVAVKVLGAALAGDGRAAERLRREARAAARLDHPNIARMLDLGEHDGRPYLVMELLEGESLATRIDRAGPIPPAEAARVVAAVADALQAAHSAGVVHRDVKPGNVYLTSGGEVKVLDFGIASAAGETDLTTGDLLGTAAYLAPERALGRPATPAADLYSLGVVLYQLLAGRRPFQGGSDIELAMAHVTARPVPLALVARRPRPPWSRPAGMPWPRTRRPARRPRPPSPVACAPRPRPRPRPFRFPSPPRPPGPGPGGGASWSPCCWPGLRWPPCRPSPAARPRGPRSGPRRPPPSRRPTPPIPPSPTGHHAAGRAGRASGRRRPARPPKRPARPGPGRRRLERPRPGGGDSGGSGPG
jgi:serine/threonine protein kinase